MFCAYFNEELHLRNKLGEKEYKDLFDLLLLTAKLLQLEKCLDFLEVFEYKLRGRSGFISSFCSLVSDLKKVHFDAEDIL